MAASIEESAKIEPPGVSEAANNDLEDDDDEVEFDDAYFQTCKIFIALFLELDTWFFKSFCFHSPLYSDRYGVCCERQMGCFACDHKAGKTRRR